MRNSQDKRLVKRMRSLLTPCIAFLVLTLLALPLSSKTRSFATSVNVVNNSNTAITNVYSSHVDEDDWSDNLLGNTQIAAGQSSNLTNLACDGQQMKVIAEDANGCFLSTVVNCGSSSTWTITNDTSRNCGSGQ